MIYIWDNEKDYSDHTIYFIESPFSTDITTQLLLIREPDGKLIGVENESESVRDAIDALVRLQTKE